MNRMQELSQRVRVGFFLLTGVLFFGGVVFILGRSEALFAHKATLHTSFENTGGLIAGAPVRLAGVDIGIVRKIAFDKNAKNKRVQVDLHINAAYLDRIRTDSIAKLASKGLLGDMLIDITVGDPDEAQHKDGDTLPSEESPGLQQVAQSLQEGIGHVQHLATTVDVKVSALLSDQLVKDVGNIMHSTAGVMENMERGKGLAHAIIYDPQMTADAKQTLANVQKAVGDAEGVVASLEGIVKEIQTGNGALHGLVYDKEGGKMVAELSRTATELADVVKEVQTGNGMIHTLVYEKDRSNLVQDLAAAAKIVRKLAEETNQGKGTIGALLKDPSIYEDLKSVLGNIKRNVLLRAVVRYTIKKDDLNRTGDIQEQAPPPEQTK